MGFIAKQILYGPNALPQPEPGGGKEDYLSNLDPYLLPQLHTRLDMLLQNRSKLVADIGAAYASRKVSEFIYDLKRKNQQ